MKKGAYMPERLKAIPKRILVVDDEPDVRESIQDSIYTIDAEIVEAWDGLSAQKFIAQSVFDLIICDFNMPNLNGLEFLSALIAQRGKLPPVIMLTGRGSEKLREQALEMGCIAYVEKPFDPESFLKLVEGALDARIVPSVGRAASERLKTAA